MAELIVNTFLQLAKEIIYFFLSPFDNIISQYFPGVDSILDLFLDMINFVSQFFCWILSWFNVPPWVFDFICLFFIGQTLAYIIIMPIKNGLKWLGTFL